MRSEERAHNERLANDRYREAGRDKHPLRSLRSLLFCYFFQVLQHLLTLPIISKLTLM